MSAAWALMLSNAMGKSGKGYRQYSAKRNGVGDRRSDKVDVIIDGEGHVVSIVPINPMLRRYRRRYG